eukprot:TRINITY_DN9111_c0_g1_i5.p2 TRINITY_DN9111_c0_g1~~TRINITY_DN9111_c0_g1_i5.p2  ORF type:complete len:120 (-),score=18.26 TRINITY_DN9111_c0_g1_i5:198-557(-)
MHRTGHKFSWDGFFLPINQVAVCIPPFLVGYQLDYALWNKGERVAEEATKIREGAPHRWFGSEWLPVSEDSARWFNQPLVLPPGLHPAYEKLKSVSDTQRRLAGLTPEADWAVFESQQR